MQAPARGGCGPKGYRSRLHHSLPTTTAAEPQGKPSGDHLAVPARINTQPCTRGRASPMPKHRHARAVAREATTECGKSRCVPRRAVIRPPTRRGQLSRHRIRTSEVWSSWREGAVALSTRVKPLQPPLRSRAPHCRKHAPALELWKEATVSTYEDGALNWRVMAATTQRLPRSNEAKCVGLSVLSALGERCITFTSFKIPKAVRGPWWNSANVAQSDRQTALKSARCRRSAGRLASRSSETSLTGCEPEIGGMAHTA